MYKLYFDSRKTWLEACMEFTKSGYGFEAFNKDYTIILTGAY